MSIIGGLGANLRNFLGKKHIQIGLIVFLVALLSFGIGYIFGRDFNEAPIVIQQGDRLLQ